MSSQLPDEPGQLVRLLYIVDVLCWTLTNAVARQVPDEPWPADQPLLVFSAVRSQLHSLVSLCFCPLLDAHKYVYLMLLALASFQPVLMSFAVCSQIPLLVIASFAVLCWERSQVPDEPCHLLYVHKYTWWSLLLYSDVNAHKYLMSLGQLISLCWCSLLYAHNCRFMLLSLLLDRSCTNSEKKV